MVDLGALLIEIENYDDRLKPQSQATFGSILAKHLENVCFGSGADIKLCNTSVRFQPTAAMPFLSSSLRFCR